MKKTGTFKSLICQFREKYAESLPQILKENNLDERKMDNLFTLIKMKEYFLRNNYQTFQLKLATPEYYENDLAYRSKFLGSLTTDHLCKTMIMENKNYKEAFES